MRIQKLLDTILPGTPDASTGIVPNPDPEKNADAYAELVQYLDDKSLNLIIRDATNDGRKALAILRKHYLGTSKQRIISKNWIMKLLLIILFVLKQLHHI